MISLKLNNILRPIGIHIGILIGLFLSKFFYYLIFTQKHSFCPKEYRGKKIRLKIALISLPVILEVEYESKEA